MSERIETQYDMYISFRMLAAAALPIVAAQKSYYGFNDIEWCEYHLGADSSNALGVLRAIHKCKRPEPLPRDATSLSLKTVLGVVNACNLDLRKFCVLDTENPRRPDEV